ncbi:MAG: hypothetical protein SCH68_03480, partial [Brevefilum sp.]|nr:hypothetical protein [Brevefilum sp.]
MMDNSHQHEREETTKNMEKDITRHDMENHESISEHEGYAGHESHGEHDGHVEHEGHAGHESHGEHNGDGEHEGHGEHVDHTGHEEMFRRKFWISLLISIPVLIFSPTISNFLGYNLPDFPGIRWITPVFSVIVFFYGGLPFIKMAVPEIKNRKPGMMTLISLAIIVAFVYSLAALFMPTSTTFFWELVTLID